jgi:hypothetical protein
MVMIQNANGIKSNDKIGHYFVSLNGEKRFSDEFLICDKSLSIRKAGFDMLIPVCTSHWLLNG